MRQSKLERWVGPLIALYLLADAARAEATASPALVVGAVVVLAMSLTWLWVAPSQDGRARRVSVFGVLCAVGIVPWLSSGVAPLVPMLASGVAFALGGGVLADIASATDVASSHARTWVKGCGYAFAGGIAVLALGSMLGPWNWDGNVVVVSAAFEWAPQAFAGLCVLVALGLHIRDCRRDQARPAARVASGWGALSLSALVVIVGAAWAGHAWAQVLSATAYRALMVVAVGAALTGHVILVRSDGWEFVTRTARFGVAFVMALCLSVVGFATVLAWLSPSLVETILLAASAILLTGVFVATLRRPVARMLMPARGRWLDAVDAAHERLAGTRTLADVARAVLVPLRDASRDPAGRAVLYAVVPDREATVDAAGEPHVHARSIPESLAERLRKCPGEPIIRAAVERRIVRAPELRPLIELLLDANILCVLPLGWAGEPEGALVLPRGTRRSCLGMEELKALDRLSIRLGALLAGLSSEARAEERAERARAQHVRLVEHAAGLEEQVSRLRADVQVLAHSGECVRRSPIGYSSAMRETQRRVEEIAAADLPVMLVAEHGLEADRIAYRIHERSVRSQGPFVVGDCGPLPSEELRVALFGNNEGEGSPAGWLRLARGGTLLLLDFPAIDLASQRRLGRLSADGASNPMDVRLIATARTALPLLIERGAVDPELGTHLSPLVVEVPPLRRRREDIASLTLIAIDRACRVLGRPIVGVDRDALDVLSAYGWPGNLLELQVVIDQAVRVSEGPKVRLGDLPAMLRSPVMSTDLGMATAGIGYDALERQILEKALDQAGGNKSAAARLLGLKRTTFIDKLRRFEAS